MIWFWLLLKLALDWILLDQRILQISNLQFKFSFTDFNYLRNSNLYSFMHRAKNLKSSQEFDWIRLSHLVNSRPPSCKFTVILISNLDHRHYSCLFLMVVMAVSFLSMKCIWKDQFEFWRLNLNCHAIWQNQCTSLKYSSKLLSLLKSKRKSNIQ